MNNWRNILISPNTKIQEALKIIDLHSLKIALVIDQNNRLIGTVTDGDIRRGILNGVTLDTPVQQIMNKKPITIPENNDKKIILNIMRINKLNLLPILDHAGCVVGIERLEDMFSFAKNDSWVVLMAGGLGNRLRPLTENCPKPMLKIGDKPILETTLNRFIEQGFSKFCFSVNYKAEQIKTYFGDGSKWGVEIHYLQEDQRGGTAGSLSLFPVKTEKPIIVMNGDILTKVNLEQLINFHLENQAEATIAVRTYDFQVPYGVVKVKKNRLIGFDEKPVHTSFINAGIYVLNPNVIKNKIPSNTYFDINHLFEAMLEENEKIFIFPIREYWIDIGGLDDFNRAKKDFEKVFK
jgi:dTDP-glucose pyrophosphorylase